MIDEAQADGIAFARLLLRGELSFEELRRDLLFITRNDLAELSEAQIAHRKAVWNRTVKILLEQSKRRKRKHAAAR